MNKLITTDVRFNIPIHRSINQPDKIAIRDYRGIIYWDRKTHNPLEESDLDDEPIILI